MSEWAPAIGGTLAAVAASVVFILGIIIGLTVVIGVVKLRSDPRRGPRSLDEVVGGAVPYLPASVPRGPVDQLHSPELLERTARNSS